MLWIWSLLSIPFVAIFAENRMSSASQQPPPTIPIYWGKDYLIFVGSNNASLCSLDMGLVLVEVHYTAQGSAGTTARWQKLAGDFETGSLPKQASGRFAMNCRNASTASRGLLYSFNSQLDTSVMVYMNYIEASSFPVRPVSCYGIHYRYATHTNDDTIPGLIAFAPRPKSEMLFRYTPTGDWKLLDINNDQNPNYTLAEFSLPADDYKLEGYFNITSPHPFELIYYTINNAAVPLNTGRNVLQGISYTPVYPIDEWGQLILIPPVSASSQATLTSIVDRAEIFVTWNNISQEDKIVMKKERSFSLVEIPPSRFVMCYSKHKFMLVISFVRTNPQITVIPNENFIQRTVLFRHPPYKSTRMLIIVETAIMDSMLVDGKSLPSSKDSRLEVHSKSNSSVSTKSYTAFRGELERPTSNRTIHKIWSTQSSATFMVYITDAGIISTYMCYAAVGNRKMGIKAIKCQMSPMVPGDSIDNDCDGSVDEETDNYIDDDGDGRTDEDVKSPSQVDGGWGRWQEWICFTGNCNVKKGNKQRFRDCDEPPPANGGKPCVGEQIDASTKKCAVSGICPDNCPDERWDWGCIKRCPIGCASASCTHIFGTCVNCTDGHVETDLCQVECSARHYGIDCKQLCPWDCPNSCNFTDGSCLDLAEGEMPTLRNAVYVFVVLLVTIITLLFPATLLVCYRMHTIDFLSPNVEVEDVET